MRFLAHTTFCAAVISCAGVTLSCSSPRSAKDPSVVGGQDDSGARAEGSFGEESARGEAPSRPHAGPHPLVDDREPRPELALPRLTYEHLGMHIGGESNTPESKRPWFEDIERHEDEILSCFRLVREPEKSGSYGVDLYVGRSGGAPEVRGSRQKLGGEDFDQCMKRAFGGIDFHEPERPTVFSYSIFFKLEGIGGD